MSVFSKIPTKTLTKLRNYCTIISSSSTSIQSKEPKKLPLYVTSKEKSRSALSLLRSENNPHKILNFCQAASLTSGSRFDRVALSTAISKLAKSNYFEDIRVFLEELKDRPHLRNERFISHSIVLYGQAGMIHDGITTFEQMEQMGIRRTVRSFNALLISCILANKYDEVKRRFTEFPSLYNIEPDVDSYNHVIGAFCAIGESSSGYSIIAEMDRKRCKPNPMTFVNLISGFYKEEKFEDVGRVLQLMKEHGMKLTLRIYSARIDSLCKLGRSFEAKALLGGILERNMKPNTRTYLSLIYGFCKEGKLEDAKKLFKDMVNHGCEPNRDCFFTLIYFLCQGGDYEAALQLSKQSMEKCWFPNMTTMKSLVKGLVSISMVEEAKDLVEVVKEKFPQKAGFLKETEEQLLK